MYFLYFLKRNHFSAQLQSWLESGQSETLQQLDIVPDAILEKKSWTFLQTRLKLLMMAYKTTLEADLKLLDDENISANRKLAIRMRLTEKRILKNAIDYVEQRLKTL